MRRFRSLVIALAVLALSAGIAFAARQMPQQSADGLSKAAEAAGKTVPVGHPTVTSSDEGKDADIDDEAGEGADAAAAEAPDEAEAPDADEPADQPDTHGATVTEAAQGETPAGWANHGAYVSAVAHGDVQPGDPAPDEAVANGGRMPKPDKAPKADHVKPDKAAKPTH